MQVIGIMCYNFVSYVHLEELGTLLPVSGGEYKYVLYVFGKPAAFV